MKYFLKLLNEKDHITHPAIKEHIHGRPVGSEAYDKVLIVENEKGEWWPARYFLHTLYFDIATAKDDKMKDVTLEVKL